MYKKKKDENCGWWNGVEQMLKELFNVTSREFVW